MGQMNKELEMLLDDAIDNYNELVSEEERLWWWDVLNSINDLSNDEDVIRTIIGIEKLTEKLQRKHAAGY
jgi:hypothetical protein